MKSGLLKTIIFSLVIWSGIIFVNEAGKFQTLKIGQQNERLSFVASAVNTLGPVDRAGVYVYSEINSWFEDLYIRPVSSFVVPSVIKNTPDTSVPTIINTTNVIERVVERVVERNTPLSNISRSELDSRLQQLDNKLMSDISRFTTGSNTIVNNVYKQIADSQRIDNLANTTISNPTINGGSITNTSVYTNSITSSGDSDLGTTTITNLNVTNNSTSTFAGGIDLTSGCLSINGICIMSGEGSVGTTTDNVWNGTNNFTGATTFVNATSTNFEVTNNFVTNNADITNLTSTNSTSTYATSTNHYITNLTGDSGNITNFSSTYSTSTNATSTNLYSDYFVAGNATTSNFHTTNLTGDSALITNATTSSLYTTTLGINSDYFTSLTGAGLLNTGGVLTLDTTGDWTGTFDGQEGTYYLDAINLTNFGTPFYNYFNATDTDALREGSINLYYLDSRARSSLSSSATGLSYATTTGTFSLTSGYTIPLTASTTDWNTAFLNRLTSLGPLGQTSTGPDITLSTSTNGTDFTITGSGSTMTWNLPTASLTNRGLLSTSDWSIFNNKISSSSLSATNNLTYSSSTGVFGVDSNYNIPLSASTTNWNNTYDTVTANSANWSTAYGWGNHASAGYLSASQYFATTTHGNITSLPNLSITKSQVSDFGGPYLTSAITSLNGLTTATQTFATTSSDGNFGFTSSGSTHTLNIPTSSASSLGLLSSDDWTIFSGKQDALGFTAVPNTRTLNTTYPIQGGGDLSADRTLTLAFGTTTNNTWSGLQSFTNNGTTTFDGGLSITNGLNLNSAYIFGAGLTSCSSASDKLIWNSATGQFSCGSDAGSGGSLISLGAQYSPSQSGSSQTFATSTSNNLLLTISSSGNTHTFTPSITTGYNIPLSASTTDWNSSYNTVTANSTNWDTAYGWGDHAGAGYFLASNFGTSFYNYFNATDTDALREGLVNKYWSDTLFDNRLSATTSLPNLSITKSQVSDFGGPYLTSAITSLNGLTTATQTFATTSNNGNFGFTSSGSTHTLNIPTASASSLGLLSSDDWTIFNNKMSSTLAKGNFLVGDDFGVAQATSSIYMSSVGNLGIGMIPTARLSIKGMLTPTNFIDFVSSSDTSLLRVSPYGAILQNISSSSAFTIQNGSGSDVFNIDTSNTSPDNAMDIYASLGQTTSILNILSSSGIVYDSFTANGGFVQNISSASAFDIQDGSSSSVFNIDTVNQRVGIGTSTPGYTLTVMGTAWVTGGVWSGSDSRWKTNIQPIPNALDKVLQLNGISYNWRQSEFPQNKFDDKTHIGFIAQDVESIVPELVTTGPDGFKGLDYNGMTSLLVGAIKELNTRTSGISSATSSSSIIVMSNGSVSIGTSTPMSKFHVFSNVNSGGVATFQDNNSTCTIDPTNGGMSCISDQNLKKDIVTLNASTTLDKLLQLRPVTYRWNGEDSNTTTPHQGFIAQEVETIFPEFVTTDSNGIKSINYTNFVPAMISAIQLINSRVNSIDARLFSIEEVLANSSAQNGLTFSQIISEFTNQFDSIGMKLVDGIAYFKNIFTDTLTVGTNQKPSGITLYDETTNAPYCLKMQNGAMISIAGECSNSVSTTTQNIISTSTTTDTTSPIISILGNNPATITVGATYSDMGATVTDINADGTTNTNLGLHYSVDGIEMPLVSIDTATTSTHTIVYSSVDGGGNWGYATRTVEVMP